MYSVLSTEYYAAGCSQRIAQCASNRFSVRGEPAYAAPIRRRSSPRSSADSLLAAAGSPAGELRAAMEKSLPLLMQGGGRPSREPHLLCLPPAGTADFGVDGGRAARFRDRSRGDRASRRRSSPSFSTATARTICKAKGKAGRPIRRAMPCGLWQRPVIQADDTTAAVAEYLLLRHKDKDHWQNNSNRPPSEAGPFTTTYVALYGLTSFGTAEQQERIAARTEQVREWLVEDAGQRQRRPGVSLAGLESRRRAGAAKSRRRRKSCWASSAMTAAGRSSIAASRQRPRIGRLCHRLGTGRAARSGRTCGERRRPISAGSPIC